MPLSRFPKSAIAIQFSIGGISHLPTNILVCSWPSSCLSLGLGERSFQRAPRKWLWGKGGKSSGMWADLCPGSSCPAQLQRTPFQASAAGLSSLRDFHPEQLQTSLLSTARLHLRAPLTEGTCCLGMFEKQPNSGHFFHSSSPLLSAPFHSRFATSKTSPEGQMDGPWTDRQANKDGGCHVPAPASSLCQQGHLFV